MTDLITLKKRVNIFLEQNTPAHIVLNDDSWYNGYIVKTYDDYFIFLDRIKGEIPVFFVDVHVFEFFKGDINTLKKIGDKNE